MDEKPDWYNPDGMGAQVCPQCLEAETEGHCGGWTSFCECDCAS